MRVRSCSGLLASAMNLSLAALKGAASLPREHYA